MVDGALSSAASLVENIIAEEEHLYGREGANAGMQRVHTAMCRCFDWSRLATSKPNGEDVREFGVLYEHLLPYMKKTLWPSDIDTKFKGVVRGWPDTKTAQIQYVVLARRVREAAEAEGADQPTMPLTAQQRGRIRGSRAWTLVTKPTDL